MCILFLGYGCLQTFGVLIEVISRVKIRSIAIILQLDVLSGAS